MAVFADLHLRNPCWLLLRVVSDIEHDPETPLNVVHFRDSYKFQTRKLELFIAPEGQSVYCGKNAYLQIGNVLPVGAMPEGTIVCYLEEKTEDRGRLARAPENYAAVIGITMIRKKLG
ncbi:hypothetical protein WA026_006903 [Henosepilachna vigintioctopunctata]|uniref:Large ribosomal subunit protein uL2 C-terminal domain-containing protein n=1 Tax=Henosepilachna vigintioctopunctata TaxID=420089 RepID=A0AAW1V2Q1_9CUCU